MVDVNGYKIKREKEPDYVTPNHNITSQNVCRTTRHYDSSFLKTNHFDTIVSYDNIPDQPPCFFILTLRSVMWSVLTLITTGLVSASVLSPSWIISDLKSSITPNKTLNYFNYWQSVGLINECHVSTNSADVPPMTSYACGVYVTGFDMPANEFPDLWKSAVIFLFLSAVLLTFTSITSVLSFCVQAIFKKSIFTVSGLIQSIAGECASKCFFLNFQIHWLMRFVRTYESIYRLSYSTRSSDSLVLSIPYVRSSLGKRAFSVIGPRLWNSQPPDTRNSSSSLPIFRSRLKTHLFKIAFPP